MSATVSAVRPRNAAATRRAILGAARRLFAEQGYDNAGLREIARDAGIDPALVCRYFGSKEKLLREVLRPDEGDPPLFENIGTGELPAYLASLVVDGDASDADMERLLVILRSSSSPQAKAIVSEAIEEAIIAPVSARIEGDKVRLRAAMALIVLMGGGIVRNVMAQSTVCELERDTIRQHLTAMFALALRAN